MGLLQFGLQIWSEQALRFLHLAECVQVSLASPSHQVNIHSIDQKYPKPLILGSVGCSAGVIHVLA